MTPDHYKQSTGQEILVPPVGDTYIGYGSRVDDSEISCAVLTPGTLSATDVEINHDHCTTAHTTPRLLRNLRSNKELS